MPRLVFIICMVVTLVCVGSGSGLAGDRSGVRSKVTIQAPIPMESHRSQSTTINSTGNISVQTWYPPCQPPCPPDFPDCCYRERSCPTCPPRSPGTIRLEVK